MYKTGKKLLSLLLAASMLLAMCVTAGAKNDGVTVTLDGKTITTEAYIDANGRTQVPNAVAEKLGVTLTLKAGDAAGDTSVVDGYFPLRYVAEANGYRLSWNSKTNTVALTTSTLTVQTLPEVGTVSYEIDPMDQTKQYYYGLWQGSVTLSDESVRDFLVYSPEGSRRDANAFYIVVPEGTDPATFLEESGWLAIADEEKCILFVFVPQNGVWGDTETELEYIDEAYDFFNGKSYFYSNLFDWRWIGYGRGGELMQRYIMANPLICAAMVVIDGSESIEKAYMEEVGNTYFTSSSRGNTYQFDMLKKEAPVPVWMISSKVTQGTKDVLEYWKQANDCTDTPVALANGTKYCQNPFSSSPITYDQKVGQVIITEASYDYTSKELTKQAYDFTRQFARSGTGSPYSNCLTASVIDESIWIRETQTIDGISREWFTYLPSTYDKNGDAMPVVIYLHGNGQSGLLSMRQGDWWKIGEEKGFIAVCPSASLLTQKNKIPIMNWNASTDSQQTTDDINFLKEMIATLAKEYNIDEGRIYLTGQSNGAGMASRAAIQIPELFAGVAVMGSSAAFDADGNPIDHVGVYEAAENNNVPMYMLYGEFDANKGNLELDSIYTTQLKLFLSYHGIDFDSYGVYTNGLNTNYIWQDDEGRPIVRWTLVAKRTHSHRPDENNIFWDDFFSQFSRDTVTGEIKYLGK